MNETQISDLSTETNDPGVSLQRSTERLLHDFKIDPLRSNLLLLFSQLIGNHNLQDIFARRKLCSELQPAHARQAFEI